MQIDFHHAVTYVLARLAGFDHADAEIVAYSAATPIRPNPRRPTCVDFCVAAMIPQLYMNAWRDIRREYL